MKRIYPLPSLLLGNLLLILLATLLSASCSDRDQETQPGFTAAKKTTESPTPKEYPADEASDPGTAPAWGPDEEITEEFDYGELSPAAGGVEENGAEATAPAAPNRAPAPAERSYEEYKVELGADARLTIPGPPGELRVWIGVPDYEAHFPETMRRVTGSLPAIGQTAQVTPFTTGLQVEPKEQQCLKIHPTGSEVRFTLRPLQEGIFKVGADVHLFETEDCSGTPVPQVVETLEVVVEVDKAAEHKEQKKELWRIFWEKFLQFWGRFLALFFGAILFLLRKQLKRWLGYQETD